MWKEFKPALRFVLWFVGLYFVGNIIYGFYISGYGHTPDSMTVLAAKQTAWILAELGYPAAAISSASGPTVSLQSGEEIVLIVYEGCNGINVFIVFIAFLIAFGGSKKNLLWFLPLGLLALHFSNLARIALLYWTALNYQPYFYYVHKYIFTAILYAVVFVLWVIWINQFNERTKNTAA